MNEKILASLKNDGGPERVAPTHHPVTGVEYLAAPTPKKALNPN